VPDTIKNRLWTRVMSYPDLKTYFLDFLLVCAESVMQVPDGSAPGDTRGWLEREVDRHYALIQAAVQADPTKPYTNDEFEAAVSFVRNFARERAGVVRKQVAASR
jgi:hypothetical protein